MMRGVLAIGSLSPAAGERVRVYLRKSCAPCAQIVVRRSASQITTRNVVPHCLRAKPALSNNSDKEQEDVGQEDLFTLSSCPAFAGFLILVNIGEDRMSSRNDRSNLVSASILSPIVVCCLWLLSGGVMESPLRSDEEPKKETAPASRPELLNRFVGEFVEIIPGQAATAGKPAFPATFRMGSERDESEKQVL